MKAYVTSIGELTTDICCEQLRRFGFQVVLLDAVEPWLEKYQRFINLTDDDCIRIDADVVPNRNIQQILKNPPIDFLMTQYNCYDFYRNEVGICAPIFYTKTAINLIKEHWEDLGNKDRPEASAWRLKEINGQTQTSQLVVGMHGFFQDKATMSRALKNKIERRQLGQYDFSLVDKLVCLLNN